MKRLLCEKVEIGRLVLIALLIAVLATGLSLQYQYRMNGSGFFTLYQGPAYVDRGWPWGFWRCHDTFYDPYGDKGCFLLGDAFVVEIIFWFLPTFIAVSSGWLVLKVLKKLTRQ